MRTTIFIIAMAIVSISLFSAIVEEKENSIMEVYYTKITEEDTIQRNEHLKISPMTLRIGPTSNMFFGLKRFWSDSLRTYDLNTLLEIEKARRESGDHYWWRPGGSEWEYIFKNMPEGMLTGSCLFDQELRYYEEEWQKPCWQILD